MSLEACYEIDPRFLKSAIMEEPQQMPSIFGTINQALNRYSMYIADVGKEIALPGKPKKGWKKYSKLFCDNVIFWALVDAGGDVGKRRTSSINAIIRALEDDGVNRSMVRVLRQGVINEDDGFFHRRTLSKFRRKASGAVEYFSIKVTLHSLDLPALLASLQGCIEDLEEEYIFLHDVDVATDCRRVTSRPILQKYLEDNFGDDVKVVNDLSRVGNHCLSWMATTNDERKVRCKVYNKFVQMMESAETTSSLGSRLESLVIAVDGKLHKRLRRARNTGLSRLEVKFYGDLQDHAYYEDYLELVKEMIQGCPTFKVPYENYWKYMASNITSMVGVFAYGTVDGSETTAFAYCHWWNSITAKKYGVMREKVGREEALKLLANYSFNDRPIYFLEVSLDDPSKEIQVTKHMRPEGCTEMTLAAGRQNGLYPYIYHDEVYEFASMGIVPTNNITIAWPERRLRKSSPPLVDIHQVAMDVEDLYMQTEKLSGTKASYKVAHQVLKERTKYTIIAAVKSTFRAREYIFATLSNGLKVRCGKNLAAKVAKWLDEYVHGKVPQMEFTTTTKRRVRGYTDIFVE